MKKFSFMLIFVWYFGLLGSAMADINSGLVAYYPFDGNSNDSSGNENHGIENGDITYTSGKLGQAASFDGIDDHVSVLHELDSFSNFTIAAWVNLNSEGSFGKLIQISSGGILYDPTNNKIDLEIYHDRNGGANNPVGVPSTRTFYSFKVNDIDNKWVHIIFIANSDNEASIYINNIKIPVGSPIIDGGVTGKYSSTSFASTENSDPNKPSSIHFSNVLLDEVKVYNRILSEFEIQELYKGVASCTSTSTGFTQTDINNAIAQGKQICINNPSSCGISSGGSSAEAGTVSANLDIYMPSLNYTTLTGTQNIWVNFEYLNVNSEGKHTWSLKDLGSN